MRTLRLACLLSLSVAACSAPDSFEGITGGDRPPAPAKGVLVRSADPNIAAPRQVSPVSVSLVATKRPRFTWELSDDIVGAVVEICPTRACNPDEVKRFEVEGKSFTMLDDLEPGAWFWRLSGMSKERVGTVASPIWELVVRGPGMKAASDVPGGSVNDIDGDGHPDLILTSEEFILEPGEPAAWRPNLEILFGDAKGEFHARGTPWVDMDAEAGEDALSSAIDTDGDGFPDFAHALKYKDPNSDTIGWSIEIDHGCAGKRVEYGDGEFDYDFIDLSKYAEVPLMAKTQPVLAAAGDVNGDGYGDVMAASETFGLIGLGSAKGVGTTMPIPSDVGDADKQLTWPLLGGFDADGDGLSDVAFVSGHLQAPLTAARGDRQRIDERQFSIMSAEVGADKAIALASGDFDGDGLMDIAATVPSKDGRNICYWLANHDKLFVLQFCMPGAPGDATYGAELAAADLDADGRDELLVSATDGAGAGVQQLTLDGEGVAYEWIDDAAGYGAKLTTIWPGRPGRAKWAAVSRDGRSVAVFEGPKKTQTLRPYLADTESAAFSYVRSIR